MLDLTLNFLLLPHDGLQTSLSLGSNVELIVSGSSHIDSLLDHLTDLAYYLHIFLQFLLHNQDDAIRKVLVLQISHEFAQRLNHPVYLHQI